MFHQGSRFAPLSQSNGDTGTHTRTHTRTHTHMHSTHAATDRPPVPPTHSLPPLTFITKTYFQIIQAIHHEAIMTHAITTNTPPPGMLRQVRKLAQFIKPACPNAQISHRVQENTDEWLRRNLVDLQQHSQTILTTLLPTGFPFEGGAFEVAARWARTRYRNRLRPTTLPQARTHLSSAAPDLSSSPPRSPSPPTTALVSPPTIPCIQTTLPSYRMRSPPPGLPPRALRVRSRLTNTLTLPPRAKPTPLALYGSGVAPLGDRLNKVIPSPPPTPLMPLPPSSHPPPPVQPVAWDGALPTRNPNAPDTLSGADFPILIPTTSSTSPPSYTPPPLPTLDIPAGREVHMEAQVLHPVTHPLLGLLSSQRSPPASPETAPPAPTNTHIYTHKYSHIVTLVSPSIELDSNPSPTHSVPPPLIDSIKQRFPSQKRTGTGTAERLNEVAKHNKMMMGQRKGKCPKKQSHSEATSINIESLPLSVQSVSTPLQGTLQPHHVLNSAMLSPLTFTPECRRPSVTTDPKPRPNKTTFKITRHDPTEHKVRDWTIHSIQPVVFIGDSNLGRILPHTHIDVQIDSYPGADFSHITQILDKSPIYPDTQHVVLALGFNNREQGHVRAADLFDALLQKAIEHYPQANIHIPAIHFSRYLSRPQQDTLRFLNGYFEDHCPHILYGTYPIHYTSDNLHWTPLSATEIFEAWMEQIRPPTPEAWMEHIRPPTPDSPTDSPTTPIFDLTIYTP